MKTTNLPAGDRNLGFVDEAQIKLRWAGPQAEADPVSARFDHLPPGAPRPNLGNL